ncbi:hypothetical protein L873DRAFT_1211238 [Choiromyces venosus 120613-1]|uniref:DUF572-domain-containing protein n=1 Tax=Choiromyces venosus 120613-1 TaxID=1336337 RepID=A0A3N4JSH1_9PEZI|nr:hypothetical protein L873DRAFT_1211238 [Choiromyces venosus 120613-1]
MQGFNMGRYVPPDQEGIYTGNQLHKKKPPGIHGNTQTVRFEMPFGIFCLTCDGHIAQGVRFNAEKKKIGKYHTTPIFSFRMRHVSCSGWIEVQTDPQNTRYVVTEGAKKRGGEDDDEGTGVVAEIRIRDPNMPDDPFAAVEKKVADKAGVKKSTERIEELRGLSDRQWLDPYEHSRKMRKVFREKRKELQAKDAATEAIRDRAGLHIELLDEIPEDKVRAQLVEFGPDYGDKVEEARTKPLFATITTTTTAAKDSSAKTSKRDTAGKTKAQLATEAAREKLQSEIRRNTRARVDPFLSFDKPKLGLEFKLLKRKHVEEVGPETEPEKIHSDTRDKGKPDEKPKQVAAPNVIGHVQPGISLGLSAYESDDD